MKKEIAYRRLIWVSAVASIVTVFAMISTQQKNNIENKTELKCLSTTKKMADLIANKMM